MKHHAEWRRLNADDWQLLFTPPLNIPAHSMIDVRLPLPPPNGPRVFDIDINPVPIEQGA